jgi:septal ring factor EnvC (AmiA/AmiB activator)
MAAAPGAGGASKSTTELAAIKQAIERVSRELAADAVKRDRLGSRLHEAEVAVAAAQHALAETVLAQAELAAQRGNLEEEREATDARLADSRARLAAQLRAAYMLSSSDPLKILLGQRDAAEGGRLLTWHGYLVRVRAADIALVQKQAQELTVLDQRLAESQQRLEALRTEHSARVAAVNAQRTERQSALETLQRDTQSRTEQLARLRAQQAELERVVRELAATARKLPSPAGTTAFDRLRGRLSWPVAGHVSARYGQQRASGVNWDGVVVATERSASVHAVAAGRVVYSDWLPGLGLLAIVDHGDGFLSLYGYNDELKRRVGDMVERGDIIAASGDTGGRSRPELYFEIRRRGKPVDPQPWFRDRSP